MRGWRRRDGEWNDSDEMTVEEVLEDHDAELFEHGQDIDQLKADVSEILTRQDLTDAAIGTLIDEAVERHKAQVDHLVDYNKRVQAGEAVGKGAYRCTNCHEYGHNIQRCPDRVDA